VNTVDDSAPVRILWPALGFPAVISPASPSWASMESRRLILLVVTSDKYLSKKDVATKLRYVPWADRHMRYVDAVPGKNAFDEVDIEVRKIEPHRADVLTQLILLAGDEDGEGGMLVGLSNFVREFYAKRKMPHLREIRISESASAAIAPEKYNLFWTHRDHSAGPDRRSEEMHLLLEGYARSSRFGHDGIPSWEQIEKAGKRPINLARAGALGSISDIVVPQKRAAAVKKMLDEYEYEFRQPAGPLTRTEVLHPLFVMQPPKKLQIGHVADLHYDVRIDAYETRLLKEGVKKFHNWNKACDKIYAKVVGETHA
ncbi:MAG: hypothetical protein ACREUU_12145, partial [Gammaproteobacteria bacterium]